jgi:quercetin dioxygenase-like cupin family protein
VVPAQTQDRERVDAVVTGIVKVTLDGESAILTAGDMVYVPRGAVRRVEVVGAATAHCLDAIYAH